MKKIRVLIVDDERSARSELRRLIGQHPDLVIEGEAANADEAEELVRELQPDLIFLDIQMPGRSGFEALEAMENVPQVIFVTAFDQYALKAFDLSALDYLLKPVREERFARAVERVRERSGNTATPSVFVKDKHRYFFVAWKNVYLIESLENYARLYFDNQTVLIKSSLNQLELRLAPMGFFRANRAQIVNIHFIKEIFSPPDKQAIFFLQSGDTIPVTERQWSKFKKINTDG